MRLYAVSGRPGEAFAQYERLREALSRRLDTEPGETTQRLREDIAAGTFSSDRPQLGLPEEPPATARHNLPAARTSFVGREQEIVEIKRELTMTRFLSLTGAGGSGKTRLALEVAKELLGTYPDGVWLVELAGLSDGTLVPQALAATLEVQGQADQSLTDTERGGFQLADTLTLREIEVLKLLAQGQTNQQIARTLFISVSTVKRHIRHISSKLGVCDRVQAAVRAIEFGLFDEESGG